MLKSTFFVFLMIATLAHASTKTLVIPHVATDLDSFQNNIVLENRSDKDLNVHIQAYRTNAYAEAVTIPLSANSRLSKKMTEAFSESGITHMIIFAQEGLYAGIEYVPLSQEANRTYIEAVRDLSQRWRIYPSNWQQTFDGVAVVNPLCFQAQITLTHFDADGNILQTQELAKGLGSIHKALYNLVNIFDEVPSSYVEITADAPIAVIGLKGTLDSKSETTFLVGNQAQSYPRFEDTMARLNANRSLWAQSDVSANYTYEIQYSCFCPPPRPVQVRVAGGTLESMTYTDDGTDLEVSEVKRYYTVRELFTFIEESVAKGVHAVRVDYDETYGYPRSIFIDYESCTVDEELSLITSEINRIQE